MLEVPILISDGNPYKSSIILLLIMQRLEVVGGWKLSNYSLQFIYKILQLLKIDIIFDSRF